MKKWFKKLSVKAKFVVPLVAGAYWFGMYANLAWHTLRHWLA